MSLERFTRKSVVVAAPDDMVATVATLMRERHVGAVVLVEDGRPVGIVTDRDLVLRVIAEGRGPATPVREVMSRHLVLARVDETIERTMVRMRDTGVRRVPIVSHDDVLLGIVTLDDLEVLLAAELTTIADAILDNRGP
jgi:CBS domain-containing protein